MENKESTQFSHNSDPEKGCCWHFAPEAGRETGPNDAMTQNFKSKPYRALVREAIQNSLDAVDDKANPVKVAISFSSITRNNYPNFFKIKEHIKASADYFNSNQKFVQKCNESLSIFDGRKYEEVPYIKIADYNTKGMHYNSVGTESPFYAFVRSAGVSSKNDQGSGGSFGFGKAAYFQLSCISSILVSTLTNRHEYVFEGISSLCTHFYNDKKVCGVGYYDNADGSPVTNKDCIPERFIRKEVGTTVFILGVHKEEKDEAVDEMISETLRSFWLAIYKGKLVVEINNEVISAESLERYIKRFYPSTDDVSRNKGLENPHPYYIAVAQTNNNTYFFEERLPALGVCQLYLLKSKEVRDKVMYMRAPQMLVYSKRIGTAYGVYGVFLCADEKGDGLLRELENPAHDEWEPKNNRDSKGKIDKRGEQALEQIRQFITGKLQSIFAENENSILNIAGTEETLYIPENLIEDDKDYQDTAISELENDTVITTEITDGPKLKAIPEVTMTGAVRIKQKGSGRVLENGESSTDSILAGIGGHTLTKSSKKGGLPTAGNQPAHIMLDSDGGSHKICVPVSFRVAVKHLNNKYFHCLIIHSPRDIIDGELEILSGGEQNDEIEGIEWTDNGKVVGNIITGVVLEQGKNQINLLFSDNMRHAIKLNAYENQ